MTIFLIKIFCWNGPEILWLELLKKCFYSYIKIMEQINLSPSGTLSLLLSLYLVVIFGHTHTIRTIYSSHSRSNSMSKNVMFTVLQLFRSSYKVKFGHLYSVILTILHFLVLRGLYTSGLRQRWSLNVAVTAKRSVERVPSLQDRTISILQ